MKRQAKVHVVATGAAAQRNTYLEMLATARAGVDVLMRAPRAAPPPVDVQHAEYAARGRGVTFRRILTPEVLAWPGWHAAALSYAKAGDEVRMLAELPFKLILVDGSCSLLPLHAARQDEEGLLLVNTAATLALRAAFEQLWATAVPAPGTASDATELLADQESALLELVSVLAAGTNDKGAAGILAVSERTLQRRVAELFGRLQARSRFQAGWLAARKLG